MPKLAQTQVPHRLIVYHRKMLKYEPQTFLPLRFPVLLSMFIVFFIWEGGGAGRVGCAEVFRGVGSRLPVLLSHVGVWSVVSRASGFCGFGARVAGLGFGVLRVDPKSCCSPARRYFK